LRPSGPALALAVSVGALLAAPARGQTPGSALPAGELPSGLRGVAFEQRPGAALPAGLAFRDEGGAIVRLGDLLGDRPAILALVYYDCPMLCTLVLNGLISSLRAIDLVPGRDFEVIAVSFDPRETPELAAAKERAYLRRYGRAAAGETPPTGEGWHFLTGAPEAIGELTDAVGFRYRYDEASGEFAHPSGLVILTPRGRISRVLYGVDYPPRDLRLALVEAAGGGIGGIVDQILLYCFHYDPATGRYTTTALTLVRLGGGLTVLALGLFVAVAWRRERQAGA
jgi:protein SCO1/2